MLDFVTNLDVRNIEESADWIRSISSEARNSRVKRFLEFQLYRLKPGESLPAIRTIRQKFGIGLNQLQKLIGDLEEHGFIERRDRSGIFKVDSPKSNQMIKTIDLVACARIDSMQGSPFLGELIHSLTERADEKFGRTLRLRQVWASQDHRSYEELASDSNMRAVILAGSPLKTIADIFTRHNIAVVELLPVYPEVEDVNVPTIVGPRRVVSRQLEHLFSLGHERIAYLENLDPRAPAWQMLCRREEFYRTMAEHGCKADSSMVFYAGTNYSRIYKTLEEKFAGKELPTAVITYDCHLNAFYKWADSRGLEIGKDISVVSTNDMPQAAQMSPAVTSLRISRDRIAELSLDALDSVIYGKDKPNLIETEIELIVRDSTGPVQK